MDLFNITPFAALFAGLLSVFSPCVLPLLPAVLAYSTSRGALRPLSIVVGLSISFITMGILTSAFGSVFQQYVLYLNIIAGLVIILMGLTLLLELNIFSMFPSPSTLDVEKEGLFGGLLLGLSLGVIWIPCVGPILGSILTLVAMEGSISYGAFLLSMYSLGFAIPMFVIAYSANRSTVLFDRISRYDVLIKKISGAILVLVGLWMLYESVLGY